MASEPINTIITEMTIAKTGLFINCLNMFFVNFSETKFLKVAEQRTKN